MSARAQHNSSSQALLGELARLAYRGDLSLEAEYHLQRAVAAEEQARGLRQPILSERGKTLIAFALWTIGGAFLIAYGMGWLS